MLLRSALKLRNVNYLDKMSYVFYMFEIYRKSVHVNTCLTPPHRPPTCLAVGTRVSVEAGSSPRHLSSTFPPFISPS